MSTDVHIHVEKDFSRYPSGRTTRDGRYSGEAFRKKFLTENLRSKRHTYVHLDGVMGYGSSFLDEGFGGLRRVDEISLSDIERYLHIITKYKDLDWEIWSYIRAS